MARGDDLTTMTRMVRRTEKQEPRGDHKLEYSPKWNLFAKFIRFWRYLGPCQLSHCVCTVSSLVPFYEVSNNEFAPTQTTEKRRGDGAEEQGIIEKMY